MTSRRYSFEVKKRNKGCYLEHFSLGNIRGNQLFCFFERVVLNDAAVSIAGGFRKGFVINRT